MMDSGRMLNSYFKNDYATWINYETYKKVNSKINAWEKYKKKAYNEMFVSKNSNKLIIE